MLEKEKLDEYSARFDLKYFFISLLVVFISFFHFFMNKIKKPISTNGKILFLIDNDPQIDLIFKDIIKAINSFVLITQNLFRRESFLRRKNSVNLIISNPFLKISFNQESFISSYFDYLYKNYKLFLKRNKFSKVVVVDEYSIPPLALVKAANEISLITIALQHGIIHKKHKGYNFLKETPHKFSIPKYTLVYSNHEKKVLTSGFSNYKKNSVKAIGSPRYDLFKSPEKLFNLRGLYKKFGIDSNKFIVLWVTYNPLPGKKGLNEVEKDCKKIFPLFYKYKNQYELLIKLHPNENQNAPIYNRWNNKLGGFAKILGRKNNTLELLYISNCAIFKGSTVGIEAIGLGRPIIILKFFKQGAFEVFPNEGFDLVVDKTEELENYLELLSSGRYNKKFEKLRESFVKRRFSNFGNSTEKVIHFLKNV